MDEIISMQSVVKVSKEGLGRSMDAGVVILNLQTSTYYGLDPVGAYVWSLMQRATSVRELRDAMLKRYEVDEHRCERELLELLQTMHNEGLIEVQRARFR
jgi:Coenzyme PQQ synthesis protein D (PqqD)